FAPVWVIERAFTSWVALAMRAGRGGVRYSNGTLRVAANSERTLRDRYRAGFLPTSRAARR
ncbi:MAG TPA: hypothetical protein VFE70_02215, partial [Candidatus Elarobacter sp.]|nr:hypothetical protein [Candidatus Elarobacter sp.]